MKILKPITQESVAHLFPHLDDLAEVVEFAEDDMLELLPYAWVKLLKKEGFVE